MCRVCRTWTSASLSWAWGTPPRHTTPPAGTVLPALTTSQWLKTGVSGVRKTVRGRCLVKSFIRPCPCYVAGSRTIPLHRWTQRSKVCSRSLTCSGGRGTSGSLLWIIWAIHHLQTKRRASTGFHVYILGPCSFWQVQSHLGNADVCAHVNTFSNSFIYEQKSSETTSISSVREWIRKRSQRRSCSRIHGPLKISRLGPTHSACICSNV